MPHDNLWKHGLLASGAPLEFETTRLLVSKGFNVHADYKFTRTGKNEAGGDSVDLFASVFAPFPDLIPDPEKRSAHLGMLVECHYGGPDEVWLFMPDLNNTPLSQSAPGHALRAVDNFSPYTMETGTAESFGSGLAVCRKVLRINMDTGAVDNIKPEKGIEKLQYALPAYFSENVLFFLGGRMLNNIPFFFCPVYLTTSRLFAADENLTAEGVAASACLEDVAREVSCLIVFKDCGPDFEHHCHTECARMKTLQRTDRGGRIDQKRARHFKTQEGLPFTIMDALVECDRYYMNTYFTRFVICSHTHFPVLVDEIKTHVASTVETIAWIE